MSGTAEILQEYLVSVGFQTDAISMRKADAGLTKFEKGLFRVSGAVIGAVASVEAATAAFAYSMRKVYFEAELAGSSVKHLKELEYAGRQIGISADSMSAAVHNMATAMRLNPGLKALVESFGVKVEGRDVSDVMVDFVRALDRMPEFEAAKFAQMLGIDPDTYHLMRTHMDELLAKRKQMADMYKELGFDPDKAKQTTLDYANTLDQLKGRMDLLAQSLMVRFEPAFLSATAVLIKDIDWWIKWGQGINHVSSSLDFLWQKLKQIPRNEKEQNDRLQYWMKIHPGQPTPSAEQLEEYPGLTNQAWARAIFMAKPKVGVYPSSAASSKDPAILFPALEQKYHLPPGLLGAQFQQESGQGKYLYNKKSHAAGPFQIIPKTQKALGLHGNDAYDLAKSANAAARMDHDLLHRYHGSVNRAMAAYNWGMGNKEDPRLDADLAGHPDTWLSHSPKETQDYVSNIEGYLNSARLRGVGSGSVTQNNTTNVTVHSPDPATAGSKVAGAQSRVYGDYLRNMKGIVQ